MGKNLLNSLLWTGLLLNLWMASNLEEIELKQPPTTFRSNPKATKHLNIYKILVNLNLKRMKSECQSDLQKFNSRPLGYLRISFRIP